jgi:PTH1 family peptidyl-tRNA hydrolase
MVIEELKKRIGCPLRKNFLLKGYLGCKKVDSQQVLLVKPTTFMNNSGVCVGRVLDKYKVSISDLLVIYDDADLPLGTIRFRMKGSSGGHRGLGSIIDTLGDEHISRLRIGIGRDDKSSELSDYVLGDFSLQERLILSKVLSKAASLSLSWVIKGADFGVGDYNVLCE